MLSYWRAPLLRDPEPKELVLHGRTVRFLVVARVERMAEKVRAFIVRGRPEDAYDLYRYAKDGIGDALGELVELVPAKIGEDDDLPQ